MISAAGAPRKQSIVLDHCDLWQPSCFATISARLAAHPLCAGWDHGSKFVPDWAIAFENNPEMCFRFREMYLVEGGPSNRPPVCQEIRKRIKMIKIRWFAFAIHCNESQVLCCGWQTRAECLGEKFLFFFSQNSSSKQTRLNVIKTASGQLEICTPHWS